MDLTCLVESGALCPHLSSIMGRIHFDFEWTDWNFLIKANHKIIMRNHKRLIKLKESLLKTHQSLYSNLVCKQHHDGVSAWTGGSVLDSKGVIVILDDVKVDVCLSRANHPWGTLDSNADVP